MGDATMGMENQQADQDRKNAAKECDKILKKIRGDEDGGGIGGGASGSAGSGDHLEPDPDTQLHFFGIDADAGQPLFWPLSASTVSELALHDAQNEKPAELVKAKRREEALTKKKDRGFPPPQVDADDLASAGWGVIFADDVGDEVKEALVPLLAHRRAQAGDLFKRFESSKGLRRDVRALDWLAHLRAPPALGDVSKVPYYLMVVGDPKSLPFGFEFDLNNSSYAVGRLAFDTVDEYARYAANVVEAEASPTRPRRLAISGMHHPNDVTCLSRHYLAEPLAKALASFKGWEVVTAFADEANKERTASFLGGSETPAIFFNAGHGVFGAGHVGSLLCAGYPGPEKWTGPLPKKWIFGHDDLDEAADLRGMLAVLFGCYTAGVPEYDTFSLEYPRHLGVASMATLAKRMLSHPRGASAVLGHVDRAWVDSFLWRSDTRDPIAKPQAFESLLWSLMKGRRIGAAAAYLQATYYAVASEALDLKLRQQRGEEVEKARVMRAWRAERDARSYLIYGDPAARPAVA